MRVLDWIGRVAVLVLSTLATLAIVGSLVSVSAPDVLERGPERGPEHGEATGEMAIEPVPTPDPTGVTQTPVAAPDSIGNGGVGDGQMAMPAPQRTPDLIRWLRALTYAVLGLAGFVAVLAIVAMRATAHLGAIADRR
ncbi:hypothetical protein DFR49_2700 [Hephaestia caeni]|uniref:Uncharacterized protein n=1 Tax=Hephaestia caeni TaxID=645617 RepID=A0A397PB73_9SPHN|nr:hypothetical protein [Hephaestia caeni]RIA44455.1 hypothetical protein DFR49_2700 [Hephaestia caeni]